MALVSLLLPTMDACKALDDDGCSSEVSRLQGGMLPAAPLTIVGVPNDHPGYITGLTVAGNWKNITGKDLCSQSNTALLPVQWEWSGDQTDSPCSVWLCQGLSHTLL